jgi:hypothetical protein
VSHPTAIGAARVFGGTGAPVLLQRVDPRFMTAVRDELGAPARWPALRETVARERPGGTLTLFQPTHRTFHLAVAEATCLTSGAPRLDPARIESSGLVIRRVVRRPDSGVEVEQGWLHAADGLRGWVDLVDPPARDADPDAPRRRAAGSGHPALDRRLATRLATPAPLSEAVSELFVLPPEVCAAAQATLLYGLVPTTSLESTQAPRTVPFTVDELIADRTLDFPSYFRAAGGARAVPRPAARLSRATAKDPASGGADMTDYIEFVKQVVIAYDLRGDSEAARQLRRALDAIALPHASGTRSALAHLEAAADVLVLGGSGTVEMPLSWPGLSAAQQQGLASAVLASMQHQLGRLGRDENRFAERGARYVARAFMRVMRDDGCPPQLVWSARTEPFVIAPWYETGPGPIPVVELPEPSLANLRKLRPNVAFQVPPTVAAFLRDNQPKKLLAGDVEQPGPGIGWLCSFNIPIITLCAFIILNIFLGLLQIVFWWLPFVKICLPYPKR